MKANPGIPRSGLSVSARLTIWYGLTLFVLLSFFAVYCYSSFHINLHRDYDKHLTHEQRELLQYIHLDDGTPHFELLDNLHSVAYQTDGLYGTFVRLLSVDGRELYQSPNFENLAELPIQIPETVVESTISRIWEDKPSRTRYVPLTGKGGETLGWLEVTGFEWSLHQQLIRLGRVLILGIVLSTILSIVGGFLLSRRALRPVAALTAAAKAIRASDLRARLPTNFGARDELTDLTETFNEMIERLESSFNHERRFSSNAAHELLTPLTTLRNSVDVALQRDRDVGRYKDTLRSVLVDVEHMTETVRGLLRLAHAESSESLASETVNLSMLTTDVVNRISGNNGEQTNTISCLVDPNIHVLGDPALIHDVLINLLENSIKYSAENEEITISLRQDRNVALLTISDKGIGFEVEQSEQLFDRFYRGEGKIVREQSGSGLGLTVAKTVIESYGGTIAAESQGHGLGSTFVVTLPLATIAAESVV